MLSALLGGYLIALLIWQKGQALTVSSRLPPERVVPALVLALYNQAAFGSPLTLGYFHEDIQQFRDVHNAENPLGLRAPDFCHALPLLWGRYRGLLFYAPIVALAVPGWLLLLSKRYLGLAVVSLAACLAVYFVNLSYPEWTGGWSTGPRLLTPLLPFAMLAVAGFLSIRRTLATLPGRPSRPSPAPSSCCSSRESAAGSHRTCSTPGPRSCSPPGLAATPPSARRRFRPKPGLDPLPRLGGQTSTRGGLAAVPAPACLPGRDAGPHIPHLPLR